MFTSYFGNLKNVSNPLSISRFPPKWYSGPELKMLAPPASLLQKLRRENLSQAEYRVIYTTDVLSHFDPKELFEAIIGEHGQDVTLLCFEDLKKPGEWCHRRMVAEWFEEKIGVEVPEWRSPENLHKCLQW